MPFLINGEENKIAERRMFALKIIDSDAFLDMPDSAQNLYFHLNMRADDDGFISNAKKVMRMIGASDDNLKILLAKRFLLSFDTGIVVIKHWRLHNYIAKDRYTETIYKEEKDKLFVKANGSYTDHPEIVSIPYTSCIQDDDTGKVSKGKVSEVKDNYMPDKPANTVISLEEYLNNDYNIKESKTEKQQKHKYGSFQNVLLTDDEKARLQADYKELAETAIQYLSEYKVEKGYTSKSDNLTIRRWVIDAVSKKTGFKPEQKKQKEVKKCTCGGRIINSVCDYCATLYDAEGNKL